MPEPQNDSDLHPAAFGGLTPGSHDFSQWLMQMGGPDFWQELVDYQGRRATVGPRPGYNYRTKQEREPKVAADIQGRLNALYDFWRSRGWSPLESEQAPTPVVPGDSSLDEARRLSSGNTYINKR